MVTGTRSAMKVADDFVAGDSVLSRWKRGITPQIPAACNQLQDPPNLRAPSGAGEPDGADFHPTRQGLLRGGPQWREKFANEHHRVRDFRSRTPDGPVERKPVARKEAQ